MSATYIPLIYRHPGWAPAFWICFVLWIGMECWVWWRERGGTPGDNRDRGSKWWLIAWMWAGWYGAFALMFLAPAGELHVAPGMWLVLGLFIELLGVGLRYWAIRTLGQFFRTSVIIQGEHRMITHGPYRFLRNPSYSGAMLASVGLGLAMLNWISLAVIVPLVFIAYWRRIVVEQQALTEHFGEPYRAYVRRSWALIPYVW